MPLSLSWQLLNHFLLSPWGLVVPITLLITLVVVQQIKQSPAQLALFYAEQFETAGEAELPRLIDILVQMGDPGVRGLVKGLTSNREVVFTACLDVLQSEFDHWQESSRREHHFRVFAKALLHESPKFSSAAQVEAMRFVDQMMRIRPATPESTADRQAMLVYCERILVQLENVRRRRSEPSDSAFAPQTDTVAALDRRAGQPVLLASSGLPFALAAAQGANGNTVAGSRETGDQGWGNPLSDPRASRLIAHQRLQQDRPTGNQGNPRLSDEIKSGMASFAPPSAFAAEVAKMNAQNFDISQDYRHQIQSESEVFGSNSFLTAELRNLPLDQVSGLTTTQLMRLLHHPEPIYVEAAQRTLASRDGFQQPHMSLAWRLFHPVASVRREVVAILPHTPNVQPSVWLMALFDDPDNDVRHQAATSLATMADSDPRLRQMLIDRGKRDSDVRIVGIANNLNEPQRTIRR